MSRPTPPSRAIDPDAAASDFLPPADAPATPTSTGRLLLQAGIGGVVGFAIASAGFRLSDLLGLDWSQLFPDGGVAAVLVALVTLVLAFWLQVLLHEAGHALAGIAGGMRPLAFGVGPLRLERGARGWAPRWGGRMGAISGFALLLPDSERPPGRLAQAAYLLGGPLANLAVAALALAAMPMAAAGAPTVLLAALVVTGVFLGLINLVPFSSGGWLSDGAGLVSLWRRPGLALAALHLQQVVQASMQGRRPRDWPAALLPAPAAPFGGLGEPAVDAGQASLRISRALDAGDAVEAEAGARFLLGLWPAAPAALRPGVAAVMAVFCLLQRGLPAEIRAWRERMAGNLLDIGCHEAWIDAELAWLEGDPAAAREAHARAVAALPRVHDAGTRLVVAERLDGLATRLAAPVAT